MKLNKKIKASLFLAPTILFNVNNIQSLANQNEIDSFLKIEKIETQASESAPGIVKSSDGGYLILNETGYKSSIVITKYNSNGTEDWNITIDGSYDDTVYSGIELENGNFLVLLSTGDSKVTSILPSGSGLACIEIAKENGDIINGCKINWSSSMGVGSDRVSIVEINDGYLLYNGSEVSKYDKEFNFEWEYQPWAGHYVLEKALELKNGNILVLYTSIDYYTFVETSYIEVLNPSNGDRGGNISVAPTSDENGEKHYSLYDVIELEDESLLGVGKTSYATFNDSSNETVSIVSKLSVDGNIEFTKPLGKPNLDDEFTDIIKSNDDGYIIIGSTNTFDSDNQTDRVIKINSDFNLEWEKELFKSYCDETIRGERLIELKNGAIVGIGIAKNTSDRDIYTFKYHKISEIEAAINELEANPTEEGLINARLLVNAMPEGPEKEAYQARLNKIMPTNITFTKQSASANVDIYIKCENMLSMSLDTNSVTFENYTGTEDLTEENAVTITVNSSLPYKVNASLVSEIKSASNETMSSDKLYIKAHDKTEAEYKPFTTVNAGVEVVELQTSTGTNNSHGIDLRIKSNEAYKADIYKTTIKFEATQN